MLTIIVIVLVAIVVLMAIGGAVAAARRAREGEASLRQQMADANEKLAAAHAEDKGWEPRLLEAAAREAAISRTGGATVAELHLVQVVDRPGTDADEAVFRVVAADGSEHEVKLGRSDGAWVPAY